MPSIHGIREITSTLMARGPVVSLNTFIAFWIPHMSLEYNLIASTFCWGIILYAHLLYALYFQFLTQFLYLLWESEQSHVWQHQSRSTKPSLIFSWQTNGIGLMTSTEVFWYRLKNKNKKVYLIRGGLKINPSIMSR